MCDYYAILDISEDSSSSEIGAAYRKQALLWHPDRNNSKDAVSRFNKVAEAYETLSDPVKKKKYDLKRFKTNGTKVMQFTSDNANDVFSKIFGKANAENIIKQASASGGNVVHHKIKVDAKIASKPKKPELRPKYPELEPEVQYPKPKPPSPPPPPSPDKTPEIWSELGVKVSDPITDAGRPIICPLEELYSGKRRIVKLEGYTKMVIVEIPPGCQDGYQLPVKNPETGEVTYFSVHAQKHPTYWRTDDNLHMNHTLDLDEFINGFQLIVTLLDGQRKKISHRYAGKCIGPELMMKIPKLGMPICENPTEHGDLYIHFKLQLPAAT